ncbi:MAG: DUF6163 family protein [Pseudorhodoplanes sp.]
MSNPVVTEQSKSIEPVHTGRDERKKEGLWTARLVLFLRVMAGLSMLKGLYHWALVCGIGEGPDSTFMLHTTPWQAATVFFAVIDLVAAVGLWLAAAWGAVIWLTASVSMVAVAVFFPQIYSGGIVIIGIELSLLACYLFLALQSAREHPV